MSKQALLQEMFYSVPLFCFRCGIGKELPWFCDHGKNFFHWGEQILSLKVFTAQTNQKKAITKCVKE